MFRTVLFKIALGAWFTLWAPLLIVALPSRWLSRKFIVWDAWGVLWVARIVAGIKYKIHNFPFEIGDRRLEIGKKESKTATSKLHQSPISNLESRIIASKHMSILEVAVLVSHVPNAFFIIKRELMWIPVYGWSFARMGLQPVDRARGATNMRKLTADVAAKIANGMNLIIFPEGTRGTPGQPIQLKRGLLFLAEQLNLPIQPVGNDCGKFWPKHGAMHPGTANIYFEPPLPPNASLDEIAAAISRHSA